MMRLLHLLALAALALALVAPGARAGARDAPDDVQTHGAVRTGALHAKRPKIPAAVTREVAARYRIALRREDPLGVHDPSCGKPRCEIDHRIPWGCRGASTADNLSYQTARAYPKKDRLEHWAERQVALRHLTVEDCQEMFKAPNDWRERYRVVFGAAP
jgi:hypothetical protein